MCVLPLQVVLGISHSMWNFTHQTLPSSQKTSPGIWKLAMATESTLGGSRTSPGEWSKGESAHIWAPYSHHLSAGKQTPLNEYKYETPGGGRSSRDRLLFPSPWPRGKALRVEMQSPTRHRQNGWDSAINGAAALSGPALEPKLQISFWAYALPVSNLVLHSCLTARERFREGEGTAWIHLRVYLLSRAHKKGKRILRKRSNT